MIRSIKEKSKAESQLKLLLYVTLQLLLYYILQNVECPCTPVSGSTKQPLPLQINPRHAEYSLRRRSFKALNGLVCLQKPEFCTFRLVAIHLLTIVGRFENTTSLSSRTKVSVAHLLK